MTEAATTQFPASKSARTGERQRIRRQVNAEAERRYLERGRSAKCAGYGGLAYPSHAGEVGGCANDGSTCICECHDQPATT